ADPFAVSQQFDRCNVAAADSKPSPRSRSRGWTPADIWAVSQGVPRALLRTVRLIVAPHGRLYSNPVQILVNGGDISGEPVLERRPIPEVHRVFGKVIGHIRTKTSHLQCGQPTRGDRFLQLGQGSAGLLGLVNARCQVLNVIAELA